MTIYPITTLSAVALGIWFVILSANVIRARGTYKVSLGDGGEEMLNRKIRAHGNLAEFAPIGLILILLTETTEANYIVLFILATVFVLGRILHGLAMGFSSSWVIGRFSGMILTFTGILGLSLLNLWMFVTA